MFSGRSRRTACPHHRRSEPSALPGVGEHFGRGDHFANLHPICFHLQGQVIQQLLTAVTCAHSPTRGHRVLSTQNRAALRVKQDAARTMTCGNAKPQAGVGAVGCGQMPFGAVQRRSGHPVAPNLLPRSRARDRVDASRLRRTVLHVVRQTPWPLAQAVPSDANARSATIGLNCSRSAPAARLSTRQGQTCRRLINGRSVRLRLAAVPGGFVNRSS